MLAKGRDASMLFPAVVKNVVSKNIEIKKLVYVYLERYAEDQQDLALLSIATFQRALKVGENEFLSLLIEFHQFYHNFCNKKLSKVKNSMLDFRFSFRFVLI